MNARISAADIAEGKENVKVVIGKDTRISGDMLESSLISGMMSVGANVVCVGVVPTPAVAYLTKLYNADCGVVISASHNPVEYNGIKFFNKDGYKIVDHYTYAISGDGCMMEGITAEAASLAGTLKLGKFIAFYDSNKITIEGSTEIAFTEDVGKRFEAYGWQVLTVEDGNDVDAIGKIIEEAKADLERPSLIIVKTQIFL